MLLVIVMILLAIPISAILIVVTKDLLKEGKDLERHRRRLGK